MRKYAVPTDSDFGSVLWGRAYLFPGEDMLIEKKLDLFVGDVDAELLEGVLL